jgi:bifunctional UDP-N-acetylglucosamine pyrophosphorylase/glucosamine-1-phosphate N-acetyltransferase
MGSGTVLANLRLDESPIFSTIKQEKILTGRSKLGACIGNNVRIGVNVSIMPGVKIGKGAFVGAGVVLGEDIPDGMYCRISPTVIMSKNTKSALGSREEFKKKI